jgi:hypothetical protein
LVALLAVFLLVAGVGARMVFPNEPGRSPAVPAAIVSESPMALGLDDILLRVDIAAWNPSTAPADPEPDGSSPRGSRIDLFRILIEADAPYEEYPVDLGTRLLLVESGTIEATLDGPSELFQAGAADPESVGAGSPVTLWPGDALVTPGGTHRILRAVGSPAATALQLMEHRWIQKDLGIMASGPQPEMLARGSFVVTIARGDLSPDGVLPPLAAGAIAIVEVEEGHVEMERPERGGESSFTYSRGGDVVMGADLTATSQIRNTSTEPAQLLVVLFEPAD